MARGFWRSSTAWARWWCGMHSLNPGGAGSWRLNPAVSALPETKNSRIGIHPAGISEENHIVHSPTKERVDGKGNIPALQGQGWAGTTTDLLLFLGKKPALCTMLYALEVS